MTHYPTSLSGGNSEQEPPDPISNSEVKLLSADGSVGPPHVRVGHRQALNTKTRSAMIGFFFANYSLSETGLSQVAVDANTIIKIYPQMNAKNANKKTVKAFVFVSIRVH